MESVIVWLHWLAVIALGVGAICAIVVAFDVIRHPQQMWIMNVVWPVNALFGTVITLWLYFRYGRLATREEAQAAKKRGEDPPSMTKTPFPIMVAKGANHCGSGCALGDICAEWLAFGFPVLAAWLGWHVVFDEKIFAVWILDFIFAFCFGVAFQYFTIVPMRGLGFFSGIWQAIKADTLSLTAWQIGMYGFMAIAHFWFYKDVLRARLEVNTPEFWFMMQIAMLCGFATSYPMNWWLIRKGVKEKM